MKRLLVMGALELFLSSIQARTLLSVKPMALHIAPKVCSCIPPNNSITPTAIVLNASNAPCFSPKKTGKTCDHKQFKKNKGCVKDVNWELSGLMRVTLDRESSLYKEIYNQRTSAERINSQAKAFGIEHPKVRNIYSVKNLNTLTYLVINVRALAKAKSINGGVQQIN